MNVDQVLQSIKYLIPKPLFNTLAPLYHWALALLSAIIYSMPSSKIAVIGVTGTKGKSSIIEMLNAIFEEAGYTTALASTIRIKVGEKSEKNLRKMSLPGRFFIQRFLHKAINNKCDVAFVELTSEGVLQYRHRFLALDTLIFTGLHKEHIEAHGSLEKYAEAKLQIGKQLEKSTKRPRSIIANTDSMFGDQFLTLRVENTIPFSLSAAKPYKTEKKHVTFSYNGEEITVPMPSLFTIYNALAAAECATIFKIPPRTTKQALEKITMIPGRLEYISEGQAFDVLVDYAHTPDSLRELYETFKDRKKICVLGAAGGGRDKWKRPEMGRIAEEYCEHIILTNEDPYNEDPKKILRDIQSGMQKEPEIIMDRRNAIREAIRHAQTTGNNDVTVIISGKGTDPYIMGTNGKREEWDEAEIARTALKAEIDAQKSF